MITLITGGIKSGKSAYALQLHDPLKKGVFIATADPDDITLKNKIAAHQSERAGSTLTTIEEKIEIGRAIAAIDSSCEFIIIDCLTLWVGNLMYFVEDKKIRDKIINSFIDILADIKVPCVIVTNEVGSGIIPENKLARQYQDELGTLNKKIAQAAGQVILMVSGIPMRIKP